MEKISIGEPSEIPEGEGVKRTVKGIDIAVFNLDGEYYAIQNRCAHKNLPLHLAGREVARSHELDEDYEKETMGDLDPCAPSVSCPWHQLEWNLESGENVVTDSHIATFDVEENDGTLYVRI